MSRRTSYTDEKGRRWAVMLPDDMPDTEAVKGIPIGPPSLEPLGLPEDVEVRLHNQLFDRNLFTERDVRTRRMEVVGAVMSTFKVDAQRVVDLYLSEKGGGNVRAERQKQRTTRPKPRARR